MKHRVMGLETYALFLVLVKRFGRKTLQTESFQNNVCLKAYSSELDRVTFEKKIPTVSLLQLYVS